MKSFFRYIWKHKTAYLMVAPLIIGVLVFCYYPAFSGIFLAFTDKTAVLGQQEQFVGFRNFVDLFNDPIFLNSFGTMLLIQIPRLIAGIVVPLIYAEIIFALRNKRSQAVYRILILLPIVAPGVVSTLVWKQIYQVDGLMNAILSALSPSYVPIDWLSNPDWVIFAILYMGFPWIGGASVLIYLSGLMNIPKGYLEAADLDGASAIQKIFKIHIPQIAGQIRYFLVFGLISGLQDYGTQVVLTNGGPGYATYVPGYYMYELMNTHGEYGKAAAIGVILFAIIMVLTFVTFKFARFGGDKEDA